MDRPVHVLCSECLCEMESTRPYGAEIRRCPRCGSLWMGPHGLRQLQAGLHDKQIDVGLAWHELASKISDRHIGLKGI